MKLKTRLKIAVLVVLIVPSMLMLLAFAGFGKMKLRSMQETYGIEFNIVSLVNTAQTINESTTKLWEKMKNEAESDPDRFLNFSYLQEMNDELKSKLSFLVVVKENEIYYQGTSKDISYLVKLLPDHFSEDANSGYNGTYIGGDNKAMVKKVDLTFSDASTGHAYIITTLEAVIPQMKTILIELIMINICVLLITAIVMTLWIYAGINAPIHKLKEATKKIADGNLDFTLEAKGEDEISELTRDFEQMRKRLADAEAEKRKYDRENKALISNISHDLKTPITTVKGYVEGIMDGVADTPEKMDRYIKTIYSKANDMDRLVNELTFYSKIDTNRIPYNFSKISVDDYFGDCAEEVSIDLEERGIRFVYENHVDSDTLIIADAEQLKRVIDNIIGNSVKYIDKKYGEIRLSVFDDGDYVRVEIEDNGKGISGKDLVRIFDRFYRTDESRSSAQGGSGIGLSIVKKIIEDHNGKIWASSQVGRGTTMHFVIRKYQEASV